MPDNGSGLFQRIVASFSGPTLWRDQADAQASGANLGPVNPDYQDIADQDFANGLTNRIAKDGQTLPTANLPMDGFRHTNCGAPTAGNQYALVSQVQSNSYGYSSVTAGTANAIILTLNPAPSAYVVGMVIGFKASASNTGAVTVNVNSLGVVPIRSWKDGSKELVSNDLLAGGTYEIIYVSPSVGFQIYNNALGNSAGMYLATAVTASAANIALTTTVPVTTYVDGMRIAFKADVTNTGAMTVNVNGAGTVPLRAWGHHAVLLYAGEVVADGWYEIIFDSLNGVFHLFNDHGAVRTSSWGPTPPFSTGTAGVTVSASIQYSRYKRHPGNVLEFWISFSALIVGGDCYYMIIPLPYYMESIGQAAVGDACYATGSGANARNILATAWMFANTLNISKGKTDLPSDPAGSATWNNGASYTIQAHGRYEIQPS